MTTKQDLPDDYDIPVNIGVWREVLKCVGFYGENNSYRSKHGGHIENKNFHSPIGQDCGKRARQLLQRINDEI